MRYLLLYLILTAISCLLHIHLFSYTLPSRHQSPTDTLQHSQPYTPHGSSSGSSSLELELEFHTQDAHEKSTHIANAITEMTTSMKGNQGGEEVSTTTHWFEGYGMAWKEIIMVLAVGNPLVLGGVVGFVIAAFRVGFGGLIGG